MKTKMNRVDMRNKSYGEMIRKMNYYFPEDPDRKHAVKDQMDASVKKGDPVHLAEESAKVKVLEQVSQAIITEAHYKEAVSLLERVYMQNLKASN